jgi:hypothetical protein
MTIINPGSQMEAAIRISFQMLDPFLNIGNKMATQDLLKTGQICPVL